MSGVLLVLENKAEIELHVIRVVLISSYSNLAHLLGT